MTKELKRVRVKPYSDTSKQRIEEHGDIWHLLSTKARTVKWSHNGEPTVLVGSIDDNWVRYWLADHIEDVA
jgi:hypothetical protein